QYTLVDRELLQRLALNARHDAGNEPARQAHLDDGDQRAVRFEGGEASAQVIQLLHGGAPSIHISADGCNNPRRRPIASLLAGLSPAGMAASLAGTVPPRCCGRKFCMLCVLWGACG